MTKATPQTHSVSGLAPSLKVMKTEGYAAQQCLKGTGILIAQLDDPRHLITLQQEVRFYRNLLELTGDPTIGLRLGAAYVPQRYGLFDYALLSAATLRHALVISSKFGDLTFTWFALVFSTSGTSAALSFIDRYELDDDVKNLLYDRDCTAALVGYSEIMGQALDLSKVGLAHDGHRRQATYRKFFHCEVAFNSAPSHVEFSLTLLDTPLPNRDSIAAEHLQQQCQMLLSKLSRQSRLIDDVRQLLVSRPAYFPDIEFVAEKLGLSVRTLRRRLDEENTSFQGVLDEVRYGLAKEYLLESQLPLQEIATLLGYGDPGNFTHAFKRWAGQAPRDFRIEKAGGRTI